MTSRLRALVLSPSASHPQDYGNRNRVWQVTGFLKEQGYSIDFLLYPFEADWMNAIPAGADEMRRAWDSFWVVPPTIPLHRQAQGAYHHIDEWWDDAIGNFLAWLFSRRSYDVFVVNYTFLSKAFTFAPRATVRVLETHDIFTGRKEMLSALGAQPEFFYTTADEERIAFDRADIVIAIKDSEATLIAGNTIRQVVALPFFPTRHAAIERDWDTFRGLSVGFIGALNSVNSLNFESFLKRFDPIVRLYCPPMRLLIAGDICSRIQTDNPIITLLGKVPDIERFYSEVDVIVAPMMFSTGIKIKVGEALSFGKGVVSTINGFDGYPATDPMHVLPSLVDVSRALIRLAYDDGRRAELIDNSRRAATLAEQSSASAFRRVAQIIRSRIRRIVFIVDEAYWEKIGFRAARLSQWAELCGYLMPVLAFYVRTADAATVAKPTGEKSAIEQIDATAVRDSKDVLLLAKELDGQLKTIGRTEVILSIEASWAGELANALGALGHFPTLDLWCAPLALAAGRTAGFPGADLRTTSGGADEMFEAMPLRYTPNNLAGWSDRRVAPRVLLVCTGSTSDAALAANEIRLALQRHALPLDIVSGSGASQALERLFQFARSNLRPMLLTSLGRSPQLSQGCRALSVVGSVPYYEVDSGNFPLAFWDESGFVRTYRDRFDLIDGVITRLRNGQPIYQSFQAPDAGWSRLWRRLDVDTRTNGSMPAG